MNVTAFLDKIPLWGIFLASVVITFLSTEFGFRVGRWVRRRSTGEEEFRPGPFAAASLGLLAFLLAMVFGAAASRVHNLKQVALDEANAIGTAYLRADLLPAADRAEIRQLLREYVALHIESPEDGTAQPDQTLARAKELQSVLWSKAATLAERRPTPISALFIDSVNQLIDLQDTRITVDLHYRLPGMIWPALFGLAILVMGMVGYGTGLSASHHSITIALSAAAAYSIVLLLVITLDRPIHLSRAAQSAMLDLQENIHDSTSLRP